MHVLDIYTLKMSSGLGIKAEPLAVTFNLLLPSKTFPAEENSGCIILVRKPGIVANLNNYSLLFFYHCWERSSINLQVGIDNHQLIQSLSILSAVLGFLGGGWGGSCCCWVFLTNKYCACGVQQSISAKSFRRVIMYSSVFLISCRMWNNLHFSAKVTNFFHS